MPQGQDNRIRVSGNPSDLRAFAEQVRREKPNLQVELIRNEADPDQLGYDAVTGVVVSAVGGLSARLAYDLLVWAWKAAIARKLKASAAPIPPNSDDRGKTA